jgi:hypothetical protein
MPPVGRPLGVCGRQESHFRHTQIFRHTHISPVGEPGVSPYPDVLHTQISPVGEAGFFDIPKSDQLASLTSWCTPATYLERPRQAYSLLPIVYSLTIPRLCVGTL